MIRILILAAPLLAAVACTGASSDDSGSTASDSGSTDSDTSEATGGLSTDTPITVTMTSGLGSSSLSAAICYDDAVIGADPDYYLWDASCFAGRIQYLSFSYNPDSDARTIFAGNVPDGSGNAGAATQFVSTTIGGLNTDSDQHLVQNVPDATDGILTTGEFVINYRFDGDQLTVSGFAPVD